MHGLDMRLNCLCVQQLHLTNYNLMSSCFVLLQEELAENIASLVNVFHTPDTGQCTGVLVHVCDSVLLGDVGLGWSQWL